MIVDLSWSLRRALDEWKLSHVPVVVESSSYRVLSWSGNGECWWNCGRVVVMCSSGHNIFFMLVLFIRRGLFADSLSFRCLVVVSSWIFGVESCVRRG